MTVGEMDRSLDFVKDVLTVADLDARMADLMAPYLVLMMVLMMVSGLVVMMEHCWEEPMVLQMDYRRVLK